MTLAIVSFALLMSAAATRGSQKSVESTWAKFAAERKAGIEKLSGGLSKALEKFKSQRMRAEDLDGAVKAQAQIDALKAETAQRADLKPGEIAPLPAAPKLSGPLALDLIVEKHRKDLVKGILTHDQRCLKEFETLQAKLLKADDLEGASGAEEKIEWLKNEIAFLRTDQRTNLALNAKAEATVNAKALTDGNIDKYSGRPGDGTASVLVPGEFIVRLDRPRRIGEIRIKLFDLDNRFYYYTVSVSKDGKTWDVVADHSKKKTKSGWQNHSFLPRETRAIKVDGLKTSTNDSFHIVEIEAYSP